MHLQRSVRAASGPGLLLSIAKCATASEHEHRKFSFLGETVYDIADVIAVAREAVAWVMDAAELGEDAARERDAKAAK